MVQLGAGVYYRLDLYFTRWPFRLLRVVAADYDAEEQQLVFEEFLLAPECDLDPFFSRRLRDWIRDTAKRLKVDAADMLPRIVDLLAAWVKRGKISIAHVERLHAQNKVVMAPGKKGRRVTVEAGILSAHLRRLMRSHIGRGRLDFTLDQNSSAYAQRLGLRLRKVRKTKGKTRTISEKVAYQNHKSGIAKRSRGDEPWSRDQEARARRRWGLEYEEMSDEQRTRFRALHITPNYFNGSSAAATRSEAMMDTLMGGDIDASDDEPAAANVSHGREWPCFDLGDDVWPVAEEEFCDFVAGQAAQQGLCNHRGGHARVADGVRSAVRSGFVIGKNDAVPEAPLRVHIPCPELHPGLCRAWDSDFMPVALQIASGMQKYFTKFGVIGDFYSLGDWEGNHCMWVCYGGGRRRDPVLEVFALCDIDIDHVSLRFRDDEEILYATHYKLANDLARLELQHVAVRHRPDTPGSPAGGALQARDDAPVSIWAAAPPPPPAPPPPGPPPGPVPAPNAGLLGMVIAAERPPPPQRQPRRPQAHDGVLPAHPAAAAPEPLPPLLGGAVFEGEVDENSEDDRLSDVEDPDVVIPPDDDVVDGGGGFEVVADGAAPVGDGCGGEASGGGSAGGGSGPPAVPPPGSRPGSSGDAAPGGGGGGGVPPEVPPAGGGGGGGGGADDGQRRRQRRGTPWPPGSRTTPFRIAPLMTQGRQVGWGADCKCHLNAIDLVEGRRTECKNNLTYGGLADAEARLRVIAWLVEGLDIEFADAEGRGKHLGRNPRALLLTTEADYARRVIARFP